LYYTASGISTPVGGRLLHSLREDLCKCTGLMIPDAVKYIFDLLMMSKQCSKHVEAFNILIIKKEFVH